MPMITLTCENCGKSVLRWPKDLRKSKHHFCSRQCHYIWKRKQHFTPHNFKANYVKCEFCGKIFARAPANVKSHVFCSKECFLKSAMQELVCPTCGKTFTKRKSRIKYTMTFCSVECSRIWHRGKNSPSYAREKRECPICKTKFEVVPSRKKKFCSVECFYQWMSRTRQGEDNPYWKPKLEKTCEICGKKFKTYPSNLDRKFCSQECRRVWIKRRGITPDNRAKMLKALLKRPTKPEQKVMEVVEEYSFPFEYVGDGSFILGGLNPDFVNKHDKQLIEVFGDYWHNPEICPRTSLGRVRKAIFASLGYTTLIIWEHEVDDEEYVVSSITDFMQRS